MNINLPVLKTSIILAGSLLLGPYVAADEGEESHRAPHLLPFPNPSGFAATFSAGHGIDSDNPFFQNLGSNGRSCATCHQQADGWTVIPAHIQQRFEASGGTDPIFRSNDGANSPNADVSTVAARRNAYGMLLSKGLIRIGIGIPLNAEFELIGVDDPYGFASAQELSLFRRPLPTTNLNFLSTVMWDARETFKDPASPDCIVGGGTCFASIRFDLADQANVATLGHAQGTQALSDAQRAAIVTFETQLSTAQVFDNAARSLHGHGARGGPKSLADETFYFGINDVVSGDYRSQAPFNPMVFDLYQTWRDIEDSREVSGSAADAKHASGVKRARHAIARGEALFNSKPIQIVGVKGLNDELNIPLLQGTCTTCHDAPNAGNHSIPAPLDIGLTDAVRRAPDMPLYTLRNKLTQQTIQITDPGRALITGKWKDIARFKGPVLRALACRAPYSTTASPAT